MNGKSSIVGTAGLMKSDIGGVESERDAVFGVYKLDQVRAGVAKWEGMR